MNIYLISGLGADSRAFKYLTFNQACKVHHLEWIMPEKKETLRDYAGRFSKLIYTNEPFVIIGLSFGGILASEMLKFVSPQKLILISSVNNRMELPVYYRWAGKLGLHRLMPAWAGRRSNIFINWLFGIHHQQDRYLLTDVLANTNIKFSRWAINAIVKWEKVDSDTENVIRIHGTQDRILPITRFVPDYRIDRGGHLMVINHPEEISRAINHALGFNNNQTE